MRVAQPLVSPPSLTFHGPSGQVIEAIPVSVDPDPASLRLTVDVTPEVFATIESAELFHLTTTAGGPGADDFRPTQTVRIELRPDDAALGALTALGDDPAELVLALSGADGSTSLLDTESWFAAAVSTEVDIPPEMEGTLREGYRTIWSGAIGTDIAPALATVAQLLVREGTPVGRLENAPGLEWTTVRPEAEWRSVALADDHGRLAIYGSLPTRAASDRYPDIALLLAHLNSGLIIGNWELAVDTGEVCMKTSIDVGDEPLSPHLARRLVERNADATAAAFDLVERLATAEITVSEAVAAAGTPNG